jgi:hypothetical protein
VIPEWDESGAFERPSATNVVLTSPWGADDARLSPLDMRLHRGCVMNQPHFFGPDPAQLRLRATLATLERRIDRASQSGLSDDITRRLRASLAALHQQLALGPAPDFRSCPQCGTVGMRNATICGNCWTRLEALVSLAPS